jgi:hypothetical protein
MLLYSAVRRCIPIFLTLLNSQFKSSNPSSYKQTLVIWTQVGLHGNHVLHVRVCGADHIKTPLLLSLIITRHGSQQRTQPFYFCVTSPRTRECVQRVLHSNCPCAEHRKHCSSVKNACLLRPFPRNWSTCHNIVPWPVLSQVNTVQAGLQLPCRVFSYFSTVQTRTQLTCRVQCCPTSAVQTLN